jgi:hypothetical protein
MVGTLNTFAVLASAMTLLMIIIGWWLWQVGELVGPMVDQYQDVIVRATQARLRGWLARTWSS